MLTKDELVIMFCGVFLALNIFNEKKVDELKVT